MSASGDMCARIGGSRRSAARGAAAARLDEEVDREVDAVARRIREGIARARGVGGVGAAQDARVEAQIASGGRASPRARRLLDALEAERVAGSPPRGAEQRLEEAARLESSPRMRAAAGATGGGDRSAAQGARARARDAAPCARKAK